MNLSILRGCLFGAALLFSSCSGLRKTSALDRLKPCKASDGLGDAYCGTFNVWEDRVAKTGRKIALKIVLLPALKQDAAPDPLFFLAGGPGQGAAELASALQEPYRRIQTDRDIVLVDQRGTGKSNPLDCKAKPGADSNTDSDEDDSAPEMVARLHACLASYRGSADVTKYTTPVAMDDLDDVRKFLGYEKINLYGVSYGTRAALVYARLHAANTRAVILDGVAPTDMRLPLYMARDSQRALDLLIRDCESDAGCRARFPNLQVRIRALLDGLGAHPQKIHYSDPRTGVAKDLELKRIMVSAALFSTLYSPLTASLVPLLVEQMEHGNYAGLFAFGAAFDPSALGMAQGMHFSVVCSEDATRIEPGSVQKEAANTFVGAEMAEMRLKPCAFWPHTAMDPAYFENAPSDLPALILSGELDPVTPPAWGQMVASQWKNSRHVVVPATGHGTWSSGCVMKVMAQFLVDGSAAKLDTGCVQRVKRPPFFLGPAGPDPMATSTKQAQK